MHLFAHGSLMLVILICSGGVLIEFVTRPLRTPFSKEVTPDCKHQFPLSRLLDPADFGYLREAGVSSVKIAIFRANRRRIARLWLRKLAADFNRVDHSLRHLLVSSHTDRPELASVLARQRAIFCWRSLQAELRLSIDACGFSSPRTLPSLETLEDLCSTMHELAATLHSVCSLPDCV